MSIYKTHVYIPLIFCVINFINKSIKVTWFKCPSKTNSKFTLHTSFLGRFILLIFIYTCWLFIRIIYNFISLHTCHNRFFKFRMSIIRCQKFWYNRFNLYHDFEKLHSTTMYPVSFQKQYVLTKSWLLFSFDCSWQNQFFFIKTTTKSSRK